MCCVNCPMYDVSALYKCFKFNLFSFEESVGVYKIIFCIRRVLYEYHIIILIETQINRETLYFYGIVWVVHENWSYEYCMSIAWVSS